MDKHKFGIHIRIEGRAYPLKIDRDEEEKYREAAKLVNETVSKFKGLFADKDSQDILAMSAFQIALEYSGMLHRKEKTLFIEELKNLNDDISDFLKEKRKK